MDDTDLPRASRSCAAGGSGSPQQPKLAPFPDLRAAASGHLAAFDGERPPASYLERIVRQHLAHHAAAIDLSQAAESAAISSASKSVAGNALLVIRSPGLKDVLRYQASHERGFFAAAKYLLQLSEGSAALEVPRLFVDEAACLNYLRNWQEDQNWRCAECHCTQRFWLECRPRFECPCGKQYALTSGTIYVGSHLPLLVWFDLVTYVVCAPELAARRVAQCVGVTRPQTVAAAIKKIKDALASDAADTLLAGVHRLVFSHRLKAHDVDALPQSDQPADGLPENPNLQRLANKTENHGGDLPA
jgi:hypothetical protein